MERRVVPDRGLRGTPSWGGGRHPCALHCLAFDNRSKSALIHTFSSQSQLLMPRDCNSPSVHPAQPGLVHGTLLPGRLVSRDAVFHCGGITIICVVFIQHFIHSNTASSGADSADGSERVRAPECWPAPEHPVAQRMLTQSCLLLRVP